MVILPLCMEHSGYYGTPLLSTLSTNIETNIWLENALRIKRSIGIQRGKSDKVDAERIAAYSLDFKRKATLWKPSEANIERLGLLHHLATNLSIIPIFNQSRGRIRNFFLRTYFNFFRGPFRIFQSLFSECCL